MLRESPRTKRSAFTLVELLVVIGIIALLISILLPALNRARASANSVKCQSNLKTIGQAMAIYVVNNRGALPIGWASNYGPGGSTGYTNWGLLLLNALDPKLGLNSQEAFSINGLSANTAKTRSAFLCPEVPGQGVDQAAIEVLHYASNPRLIPDISQNESAPGFPAGSKRQGYKMAKVKRSAEVAAFFDGSLVPSTTDPDVFKPQYTVPVAGAMDSWSMGYAAYFFFDASNPVVAGSPYNTSGVPISLAPASGNLADFNKDTVGNGNNIRFRHMKEKVANLLFLDGHCGQGSIKTNPTGSGNAYNSTDLRRETFYVNRM